MTAYDFINEEFANEFKSRVERLGYTCSSVDYSPQYGWYVFSNYRATCK